LGAPSPPARSRAAPSSRACQALTAGVSAPEAFRAARRAISNGSFDWGYLFDHHRHDGEARFAAQYWRANIEGSERYVTTYAGTVQHRLQTHESGFDNVRLAGDWTDNGIDGGSVEATVASGRLASRAICGSPREVPGTSGWLAGDGWR
jgi:hypothetical protein